MIGTIIQEYGFHMKNLLERFAHVCLITRKFFIMQMLLIHQKFTQ